MMHPFTGKELAQGGIIVATDNAEQKHSGWANDALDALKLFLHHQDKAFLCEEFTRFAEEQCGLPVPPSGRAYGGVIRKAKHENLITHAGYAQVANPKAHSANASLWIKVKAVA